VQEEIDRMIAEAEMFMTEGAAARLRLNGLNGLSTNMQIGGKPGLGEKMEVLNEITERGGAEITVASVDIRSTGTTADEMEGGLADPRVAVTTALYASDGNSRDGRHMLNEL
jgi:hypothetical protein